ncbi:permease [Chengkuizengella marina]|uniref:Permease n=1 Tax=Chengkuizengella marina TaxID=2507566 RepID=A0A6N9Q111_9BACL|nr:permease [Chengkuizengella marina]NBI28842.1 permease [Chengkuizengella marina]
MSTRLWYTILGLLLLIESGYLFYGGMIDEFSLSPTTALIFALSVNFLSLSYLHPQFKKKDERMKVIQEKGMFYSYFILLFYFFMFITLLQFNIIYLTAIGVVTILGALTIMTFSLSMVVFSKIY